MRTELPGFGEAMRAGSLKLTPNAILSRALAAVVDRSLVIALPGKPAGAVECLGFVAGASSMASNWRNGSRPPADSSGRGGKSALESTLLSRTSTRLQNDYEPSFPPRTRGDRDAGPVPGAERVSCIRSSRAISPGALAVGLVLVAY